MADRGRPPSASSAGRGGGRGQRGGRGGRGAGGGRGGRGAQGGGGDSAGTSQQPTRGARRGRGRGRDRSGARDEAGGSGRGRRDPSASQRDRKPWKIGYKRLVDVEQMTPTDIVLELANGRSGWKEFLDEKSLKPDWITLVVNILEKSCRANGLSTNMGQVFVMLCDSNFLQSVLSAYIVRQSENILTTGSFERALPVLEQVISILQKLLEALPSAYIKVIPLLSMLQMIASSVEIYSSLEDSEFKQKLDDLQEYTMSVQKQVVKEKQEQARRPTNRQMPQANVKPPDDYRELSVFPTTRDVFADERPFLRANIKKGTFEDADHYLDVQFRLIREDFVRPLRDGIGMYLMSQSSKYGKQQRITDIRLYTDVRVLRANASNTALTFVLHFDASKLMKIRWEATKRLIFGSLLCLSSDNFKTLLFATVAERDPRELRNGRVSVKFEEGIERISAIKPDTVFIMAETTAFFEAYKHVLVALQQFTADNMPFQDQLIHCRDLQHPPRYLQGSPKRADFTPLVSQKPSRFGSTSYQSVPVLRTDRWPKSDVLKLDEPQYEALQAALTREFVIIQGPPGTGKTFMGLKIAEFLLHNEKLWATDDAGEPDIRPMFVVCYTNHALDQFLEGISKFQNEGIIRVGGRCQNPALEPYLLKNRKREMRESRSAPRSIAQMRTQSNSEMRAIKAEMDVSTATVKSVEKGLIAVDALQPYVRDPHMESFYLQLDKHDKMDDTKLLLTWLGLGSIWIGRSPESLKVNDTVKEDKQKATDGAKRAESPKTNNGQKTEGIKVRAAAEKDSPTVSRKATQGDSLEDENIQDGEDEEADIEEAQRKGDDDLDDPVLVKDLTEKLKAIEKEADKVVTVRPEDLVGEDDTVGEWKVQGMSKQTHQRRLQEGLSCVDVMTEKEQSDFDDVWILDEKQRWRLYRFWANQYTENARSRLVELQDDYQRACEAAKEVRDMEDQHLMEKSTIIGMTTTGAARYSHVLANIRPKIVIVEEAAEVLEAHVISSLNSDVEHLILIGDHKQLRPSTNVYDLAVRYNLDLSLFERMIENGLDCKSLEEQHRMRPDIADNLKYIYPQLRNHPSVLKYGNVKGVRDNLFFISHTTFEKQVGDTQSKSNLFEARFMGALCRYLILQGYEPSQITVLTPYTGQVLLLKTEVKKEICQEVRVTAVDNFQGEESDIILLSLVRSNADGQMGFLSVENRMCVALSRARIGMFVVGNFQMLEKSPKAPMWKQIIQLMRDRNQIGPALQLYCQNHPEQEIVAATPEAFRSAPEGGCMKACGAGLNCGHTCKRLCHILDRDHEDYKCTEKCQQKCPDGHPCRKQCFKTCGDCKVLVEKLVPGCGHLQNVPCFMEPYLFRCRKSWIDALPCGHSGEKTCGQDDPPCRDLVDKTMRCGHTHKVPCCNAKDSFDDFKCKERCLKACNEGHPCRKLCHKTCGQCSTLVSKLLSNCGHSAIIPCPKSPDTVMCKTIVTTKLSCGHDYVGACGDRKTAKCTEPCSKLCQFGHPCTNRCFEECSTSYCTSSVQKKHPTCGHDIMMPCSWNPDEASCLAKVERTLVCGHVRVEVCGKPSMSVCLKSCKKFCRYGHSCQDKCFEKCSKCNIPIQKKLSCGHVKLVPCSQPRITFTCQAVVTQTLNCGHTYSRKCADLSKAKCDEMVTVALACGHTQKRRCCDKDIVVICSEDCKTILECGHDCPGSCHQCRNGRMHLPCGKTCRKVLVCGHACVGPCIKNCPPCTRQCERRCTHTSCKHPCSEPCTPCQRACVWSCEHYKCTKRCSEPCDRPMCDEPCETVLRCGHLCSGVCGERCPLKCRVCHKVELQKLATGVEYIEDARFVELEDCGHVFEAGKLDAYMEQSSGPAEVGLKTCPTCSTPVRFNLRYGQIINQQNSNISMVKTKVVGTLYDISKKQTNLFVKASKHFKHDLDQKDRARTLIYSKGSTLYELQVYESQLTVQVRCLMVSEELRKLSSRWSGSTWQKDLKQVLEFCSKLQSSVSSEALMQAAREADRFSCLLMFTQVSTVAEGKVKSDFFSHLLAQSRKLLESGQPFSSADVRTIMRLVREARAENLILPGQVQELAPVETVEVSGLAQDHWRACSQGHVFKREDGAASDACSECAHQSNAAVAAPQSPSVKSWLRQAIQPIFRS